MADDDISGVAVQVRTAMGAVESALDSFNRKLRTSIGADGVFSLADKALGSMAKTMLGPVGLAAGFVGVAKALESVAANAVSLQYLARDAGFATTNVSNMQGAFRMMGAGVQDANRSIGNLGDKLQSLAVFRAGSDIWQGMANFPGAGASIANTLMGIAQEGMRSGDQIKALDEMLRLFNKQSPETKFAWAQVWGESVSHLENLARKLDVVQKLGIPKWSKDEEERYLELMVGWELRVEDVWKRVAHHGMQAMNDTSKSMEEMGVTSEKVVGFMNSVVDKALKTLGQDVKDFVAIANMLKRVPENFRKATAPVVHYPQGEDPMGDDYTRKSDGGTATFPLDSDPMGADYTRPASLLGKYRGWLNNQRWLGPRSEAGTSGSTDFSSRRRSDDLVEVEKDSSKTLIEIRDTLQRMEGTGDDDRSGGDYGSGGGGRRMLAKRMGMDTGGGGGDTPAGSGPRAGRMTTNQREVAKIMREEWKNAGMSDQGIAGIMANVNDESRFDPTLRHADQPKFSGEAHYAHGLYQEGGTEWNNYDAWLKKNYPDADWRDPRLQSRFAAERLKAAYPKTWRKMVNAESGGEAAAAYVDEYLKPAAQYRYGRVAKYRRGVPGTESYTGSDEARNKVDQAQSSDKWSGGINAKVEFLNVPGGVKTSAESDGDVFKQLQISRTKQSGVYNNPSLGYE